MRLASALLLGERNTVPQAITDAAVAELAQEALVVGVEAHGDAGTGGAALGVLR